MKHGYFGGTFDPIHTGHLIIAEGARALLNLDKIFLMPAGEPPHKQDNELTTINQRMEMIRLAIEDNPAFELSHLEATSKGKSYTVETLRSLRQKQEEKLPYWIIGSDSLHMMGSWREPQEIVRLCKLVVYPRPDFPPADAPPEFRDHATLLDTPTVEISSSMIRQRVRENLSIRYLVPSRVAAYIKEHGLYGRVSS
jgi:nicotinate-nucleotide adenylyltransferase